MGHASDCATNNAPALPVGPCDCGADLLEALRNLLNGIETGAITSDHDETFTSATAKARAAIQKATQS